MTVAPTGPLSTPLAAVRTALVGAAGFVAWAAPLAAASAVFLVEDPEGGTAQKFAVVDWGFDCSREASDVAPSSTFEQSGSILLCFRWRIPAGISDEDATLTFLNALGAIMPQLETALRAAGIQLQASRLIAGPERPAITERRNLDVYEAVWQLEAKEWPT